MFSGPRAILAIQTHNCEMHRITWSAHIVSAMRTVYYSCCQCHRHNGLLAGAFDNEIWDW